MIQKTPETMVETITRVQLEAAKGDRQLLIEKINRQTFIVSGNIVNCSDDAVEFTDADDGPIVLPFSQIFALEIILLTRGLDDSPVV
jgi:hypothetical protein